REVTKRRSIQQTMAGGTGGRDSPGRVVRAGVCQRQGTVPRPRHPDAGNVEHSAGRSPAIWQLYVYLRDCLATVAGGNHRSGCDGKEEDLEGSFWLLASSSKPEARS